MSSPNAQSRPIPSPTSRTRSDDAASIHSPNRLASNARLASPVPSHDRRSHTPSATPTRDPRRSSVSSSHTPLAGPTRNPASGPGSSALADALHRASIDGARSPARSTSRNARSTERGRSPANYGSVANGEQRETYEDFEIVRRHLVGPANASPNASVASSIPRHRPSEGHLRPAASRDAVTASQTGKDEDEFSSLRLQGGDITRDIYRRAEAEATSRSRPQRTQSMYMPNFDELDDETNVATINQPGGFRRDHLRRLAQSPRPSVTAGPLPSDPEDLQPGTKFVTRNFFEFLSLYGHFAGEDVEDDDDDDDAGQHHSGTHGSSGYGSEDEIANEGTALLKSAQRRKRKDKDKPKTTAVQTMLMLLKSFVGTGVLFLPRAFLNGGMLFSVLTLLTVAAVSYYCFLLLTTSRLKLKGSFAEMGEMVQGRLLRGLINGSLVISQIGFASAYIVFTSANLQAFILAVSKCQTFIDIKYMILMQLAIFMPLSLYRNLNNISVVVYIADLFIVLGLLYLYYFGISTVSLQGVSDIAWFNRSSWTLFIGTAIFTFEGIGLIIPIQDGMKKPSQLPGILGAVMVIISVIFVSMGALAYAAFGSKTETVILLNMPQDNKFVNGVQFIYSLAILLSTPMQIFPAITIMENSIFKKKSGKFSTSVKWRKNAFRFMVVLFSAFIAWVGANDLDKFVALVGSFACIPLVYLYPPYIHFKAVATKRWQKLVDLLLIVIGFVLMAYTTALTIISWVSGNGERPSPGYCDRP